MTKAQEKTVGRIKAMMEQDFIYDKERYEIKEFEVKENDYFVSVVGEVGLKGDEGTLAQIFVRERFHLFIGKKGGITYYNRKGTRKHLKKCQGLLTISIEQRQN